MSKMFIVTVVRLFDNLYFELCQVQTPAVNVFIEPFHKCFYHEMAHVGTELDQIGTMLGTIPKLLLKTACHCDALEAEISASEGACK
jgi:hypothetical protein